MESRKMALINLLSGQQSRCKHREETYGVREGEVGTNGESSWETYTLSYVK